MVMQAFCRRDNHIVYIVGVTPYIMTYLIACLVIFFIKGEWILAMWIVFLLNNTCVMRILCKFYPYITQTIIWSIIHHKINCEKQIELENIFCGLQKMVGKMASSESDMSIPPY